MIILKSLVTQKDDHSTYAKVTPLLYTNGKDEEVHTHGFRGVLFFYTNFGCRDMLLSRRTRLVSVE